MSKRLVALVALAVVGLLVACNGGEEPSHTATPGPSPSGTARSMGTTATPAPEAQYPPKVSLTEPGAYLIRSDGSGLRGLALGDDRYRSVWSADGSHVAVGGAHRVLVIDVDGGTEVTVFDGSGRGPEFWVGSPLWSPDGRQLSVAAGPYQETTGWHVYLVNADGSGEPIDLFEGFPLGWSPDGSTLAFVEYSEKGVTLKTFDLGARTATVIERAIDLSWFAWSPDSQRMAYTIRPRLPTFEEMVVIDRDGWNRRVVGDRGGDPRWSPDAGYLAFTDGAGWVNLASVNTSADLVRPSRGQVVGWSEGGDAVLVWETQSLRRVSLATHEAVDVIDLAGHVPAGTGWVRLSPDREQIMLSVSDPETRAPGELFVMNVDGTDLQKLIQFSTGILAAEWSPDGRYIAFVDGRTAVS